MNAKLDVVCQMTETDIRRGRPGSQRTCPVARAVKRATKLPVYVRLTHLWIGDSTTGGSFCFTMPKALRNFIKRFDVERPVKPIRFRVLKNGNSQRIFPLKRKAK